MGVTNDEFLQALFGGVTDGAPWICSFQDDPKAAARWGGMPVENGSVAAQTPPDANNYVAVGVYEGRRKEAACKGLLALVLDDVGTRGRYTPTSLPLPPTYVVETSPDNFQAVYFLDAACVDLAAWKHVQSELAKHGDPSTKNATRYFRLPVGTNRKATLERPFSHRVWVWKPERRYTLEEVAQAYQIGNEPAKPEPRVRVAAPAEHHHGALWAIRVDNRENWLTVLMAYKAAGGDFGVFHAWCLTQPGYVDEAHVQREWDSVEREGGIGPGTLYHVAYEQGWRRPEPGLHFGSPPGHTDAPLPEVEPPDLDAERVIEPGEHPDAHWPAGLDFEALQSTEPEPPEFIIEDWLPAGYATLLAGHGGVGKSGIALYLAVCIALGLEFFGMPVKRRRVTYLSCEDRTGVLHWRLSRICRHLGVQLTDLKGCLDLVDLVGRDTLLWTPQSMGSLVPTPAMVSLQERMRGFGTDVVMVDGISDTFSGNENDRAQVKCYVNQLLGPIPPKEGALILIGHVAKPSASAANTSEGYSGSTGWHNAVRARWYLYPETKRAEEDERPSKTGELLLELQKSNLGASDQSMRFRWDEDAHLFAGQVVVGRGPGDSKRRDVRERRAILEAIESVVASGDYVPAATQGNRTAFNVLREVPEFPESMGTGPGDRRRFWRHIEALRRIGSIEETSIRRANRHYVSILRPATTTKANDGADKTGCADASLSDF